MAEAVKDYLEAIYYDPKNPASYGGVDKVHRYVKSQGKKITRKTIKTWLLGQPVYTSHKPVRRRFKRLEVVAPRKWYQFDTDTINMVSFKTQNKGWSYIMVAIDVVSKFCWTRPMKTLTGKEAVKVVKDMFTDPGGRKPTNVRSDKGSEYVNHQMKRYMEANGINHFTTLNETKANMAERFIRTLKTRITKYMHKKHSAEWVSVLGDITSAYNHAYHRTIRMTPTRALATDDVTLWNNIHPPPPPPAKRVANSSRRAPFRKKPYALEVGDKVKLFFMRAAFAKDYDSKWTDEVFYVATRSISEGIAQYTLKSWQNDPVEGHFYKEELQKIELPEGDETVYNIEKVIKRRTKRGRKEAYVKWEGWAKAFNTWIPEEEVKAI